MKHQLEEFGNVTVCDVSSDRCHIVIENLFNVHQFTKLEIFDVIMKRLKVPYNNVDTSSLTGTTFELDMTLETNTLRHRVVTEIEDGDYDPQEKENVLELINLYEDDQFSKLTKIDSMIITRLLNDTELITELESRLPEESDNENPFD